MIWPLHALQVLLSVLPGTLGGQKAEEGRLGPTWPSHWLANTFLLQNSLISFSWCCLFYRKTFTRERVLTRILTSWKYPDTWYKRECRILTHRGLCEYNSILDAWMLCLVSHHRVLVFESICKENQAILILETKNWYKETSIICSLENYASFNLRRIRQLLATTMLIWPPLDFL